MSSCDRSILSMLWLLPMLSLGAAHAADPFDPDLVNPTTFTIQPVGYVGAPVASRYVLTASTQAVLYTIDYNSQDWTGNLHSVNLSSAGVIAGTENWNALARVNAQNFDTGRKIVTMNGSTKIAFRWGNLSNDQKIALDPAAAAASATSSTVLNYIRGDRGNEAPNGLKYRKRNGVLGDIIHSTPRVWNDGTNRTVFVGANDGMLHAINAADGTERFAYIPSVLISKLPNLKAVPYAHKYFVDGQLAARNFGSRSILAGGLGGGGRGLFALDVTTVPTDEAHAATKILWEITNETAGFANLGHTYGTPVLTTLPDGTNALVVGNGYNNTGNGHSSLFLIDAVSGDLIEEIDAGGGSPGAPNGLSSPTVVEGVNGKAIYAYAGDIDGNLWKFNLATKQATNLYPTAPVQAITMAPGVKEHPNGGYVVAFATGRIFVAADSRDTSTHYAYGIWDKPSAFATNTTLLIHPAGTLAEKSYTTVSPSIRVRTAGNEEEPNWSVGHHMGWRTPIPTGGERVVGDGAYVDDSVFVFLSTNPATNGNALPPGENWWMQLNVLTGGDSGAVRFDLNADSGFTDADKVDGLSPVGRYLGGGVRSQLTAFLTPLYEIYIASYDVNGDPPLRTTEVVERGVAGGHFDFDIYYGKIGGAQATATITVNDTGQTSPFPATLGAITINNVVVVPSLTVSDIPDGASKSDDAATIASKVTNGFAATVSGNVVTITAPIGANYNGTINIAAGTPQLPLVPASPATPEVPGEAPTDGTLVITAVDKKQDVTIKCGAVFTLPKVQSSNDANAGKRLDDLFNKMNMSVSGYATSCAKTVTNGTTTGLTCTISAPVGVSACAGGFTVDNNIDRSSNVGPSGGRATVPAKPAVPQSGWTNLKPALTATVFSGGASGTGDAICSGGSNCGAKKHVHEYDDKYDRTGVNMLDASLTDFDLANAIPSTSTAFKVIASNQYLNPAAKIHLNGTPAYTYNVDAGYTPIKNFITSASLDVTQLPTYSRNSVDTVDASGNPIRAIRSLVINLPVDAFTPKDWWGGATADVRAGLHPTQTGCVNSGTDMYQAVNPLTGSASATGVRHNGALTIQVIKADTPNHAVEMTVPYHPEYGWRLKSGFYETYVLAEYTTFWHHPNGKCYGEAGWSKAPPKDSSSNPGNDSAADGTDPQIGSFHTGSGSGPIQAGTTRTTVTNANGSTTTTTVTIVDNGDGTFTVTTDITNSWNVAHHSVVAGGAVTPAGDIGGGGLAPLDPLRRVNWRELRR